MSSINNNASLVRGSTPSLKSVVIPWTTLALLAVAATAATVLMSSTNNNDNNNPQEYRLHEQDSLFDQDHTIISTFDNVKRIMTEMKEHYTYEHHKPLMPLNGKDFRGFFCAVIGLMIAAGGGIGGGGILVPIYILVMGFTPKHAIPLSNITVFGGALANTILNTPKRHPLADRPLVDWDLILIMEPLTIAGALIGAFLNKLLREEVLAFMLVLLLSFTAYSTLKKAIKMYRVESAQMKEQKSSSYTGESELTTIAAEEDEEDENEAEEGLLDDIEGDDDDDIANLADVELNENNVLSKILEEEKEIPRGNLTLLIIMFIVVLFINIMKGGGAFRSPLGIRCGSTSFWTANLIMIAWIVMISLMARSYLLNRYKLKESCGYK